MPLYNFNSADSNIIYDYWDDFNGTISGNILGSLFSGTNGATVPSTSGIAEADLHEGIRRLQTGTALTLSRAVDGAAVGQGQIHLANYVTQAQWVVRLPGDSVLPIDNYEIIIGLANGSTIPPSLGIYFYYNPNLYGDNFFRVRYIRGALSFEKVTTIQMTAVNKWYQFRLTSFYGNAYPNPYFEFGFRVFDKDLLLEDPPTIETITETEITSVVGLTAPYLAGDGLQIIYGLQKSASSIIRREMYMDKLQLQKRFT